MRRSGVGVHHPTDLTAHIHKINSMLLMHNTYTQAVLYTHCLTIPGASYQFTYHFAVHVVYVHHHSVQKKATMCAYAGDSSCADLCISVRGSNLHVIL